MTPDMQLASWEMLPAMAAYPWHFISSIVCDPFGLPGDFKLYVAVGNYASNLQQFSSQAGAVAYLSTVDNYSTYHIIAGPFPNTFYHATVGISMDNQRNIYFGAVEGLESRVGGRRVWWRRVEGAVV